MVREIELRLLDRKEEMDELPVGAVVLAEDEDDGVRGLFVYSGRVKNDPLGVTEEGYELIRQGKNDNGGDNSVDSVVFGGDGFDLDDGTIIPKINSTRGIDYFPHDGNYGPRKSLIVEAGLWQ
ncbi:MAG: hypothetical protein IIA87_03955 [Nanoarchaeota archaeon]|nr:hypothetical protein [Nanoarchaeota archaeon]